MANTSILRSTAVPMFRHVGPRCVQSFAVFNRPLPSPCVDGLVKHDEVMEKRSSEALRRLFLNCADAARRKRIKEYSSYP